MSIRCIYLLISSLNSIVNRCVMKRMSGAYWKALGVVYFFMANTVVAHNQDAERNFAMRHVLVHEGGHLHIGAESRYVSEGRDNLDGDSLLTTTAEMGWKYLAAGVWYGASPNQEYDELQMSLALTHSVGPLDAYVAYTHLRTPFQGFYDNELGLGLAWGELCWDLEMTLDGYYSIDAEGSFWQFGINREMELSDCLTCSAECVLGMNQGYVIDGHDGLNHVAARAEVQYDLTETLALNAHVSYSWALGADAALPGDDLLIDSFHGGLGLQWSF